MKKSNKLEFITKANLKHNNKYDYSKFEYHSNKIKGTIICETHGEFNQSPSNHLKGRGCPKCKGGIKLSNTEYINGIKNIDSNIDIESINYTGVNTALNVLCKKHGYFNITPTVFKNNPICPNCRKEKITPYINNDDALKILNDVHNNKYTYPNFNYVHAHGKIEILCSEHGLFKQSYNNHRNGQGCPKCVNKISIDSNYFIEQSKKIHNNIDYSNVNYINAKTKIILGCEKHGLYEVTPDNHLRKKQSCPKCSFGKSVSVGEKDILSFLENYIKCTHNDRDILNDLEIDILLNDLNIGIEYNGLYWHSDKFVKKNYHINKLKSCNDSGLKLIHIFEDEWIHKKEIVKSRLLNIIGKTPNKIFARKTIVREINSKICKNFLEQNHIQGFVGGKIYLGLYLNDELISVMSFGNLRKNLGQNHKDGNYEMLRFANKLYTSVVGGASKLFKYFVNNYNVESITSYADRRWSEGRLYYNLGFNHLYNTAPNYFYTKGDKRYNRFSFRKDILIKQGFDRFKSEKQIMIERGYNRIYDCGVMKFEWNKKDTD